MKTTYSAVLLGPILSSSFGEEQLVTMILFLGIFYPTQLLEETG